MWADILTLAKNSQALAMIILMFASINFQYYPYKQAYQCQF